MTSPTPDFSLTVLAYATTASACHPAAVIRTRVTAIGVLPAIMRSVVAVAKPSRIRLLPRN
jgi:hypothetical protein